jgi:DNA-binding protein YbaB
VSPWSNEPGALLAPTAEQIAEIDQCARRLANRELVGRSPDERVLVRVTATGRVTQIRLLDGVLERYDNAALSELVTRTVRSTQRRARAALEQDYAQLYAPVTAAPDAASPGLTNG